MDNPSDVINELAFAVVKTIIDKSNTRGFDFSFWICIFYGFYDVDDTKLKTLLWWYNYDNNDVNLIRDDVKPAWKKIKFQLRFHGLIQIFRAEKIDNPSPVSNG